MIVGLYRVADEESITAIVLSEQLLQAGQTLRQMVLHEFLLPLQLTRSPYSTVGLRASSFRNPPQLSPTTEVST